MIKIPEGTAAGNYDLNVDVEYGKGHEVVSEKYTLVVDGQTTVQESEEETMISIDTQTKKISQGEGAIYKVNIANLGAKANTYSLEVSGESAWGTSRVDPALVIVKADETSEAYVYISANEDATQGMHMFTLTIKSGSQVISETSLGIEVAESKKVPTTSWKSVKYVLAGVFVVLLALLVILAIALLVKRLKGSSEEEPSTTEAQTYYYYPRY
jgi:uncharacterized membrane protein